MTIELKCQSYGGSIFRGQKFKKNLVIMQIKVCDVYRNTVAMFENLKSCPVRLRYIFVRYDRFLIYR